MISFIVFQLIVMELNAVSPTETKETTELLHFQLNVDVLIILPEQLIVVQFKPIIMPAGYFKLEFY